MRALVLVVPVILLLASCASDDPGVEGGLAPDRGFSLEVPDGWREVEADGQSVQLAATGSGDEQLLAGGWDDPDAARIRATEVAVDLGGIDDLTCRPLVGFADVDPGAIDCRDRTRRPWMHKMLVPLRTDGRSVLLLVQVEADTSAEAAAIVEPVVRSFRWR
ncbi:MAG: hypothetical protein WBP61_10175 [Nocardioides sp.]